MGFVALDPRQITQRIFQGGWPLARDIHELRAHGITHLLNLDHPYEDPEPFLAAGFTLQNLFIRDHSLMTPQLAREAMEAIDTALSSPDHKIYIHCNEGVSRSPTIVWLYLIHSGLSPAEASERVKPDPLLYDDAVVGQVISSRIRRQGGML